MDQWLYSPNGTAYTADLVYFQWGLHDGALKSKTLTAPLLRQPRSDLANRPLGLRLANPPALVVASQGRSSSRSRPPTSQSPGRRAT